MAKDLPKNDASKRNGCMETMDIVRHYGDVTTLHGIRYVTDPRPHFCERLCWTIVIISCATWCGLEIAKLYARRQDSPVIITLAQQATSVTAVPFPAVTICPESKVRTDVINVQEKFEWLQQVIKNENNLSEITPEDQLLAETISLICESSPRLPDNFTPTRDHIRKMYEISPRLDDIFEYCAFQHMSGGNETCRELFRPIITRKGVCFTFNMLEPEDMFNNKFHNLEEKRYGQHKATWNLEHGYEVDANADLQERWNAFEEEYPKRELINFGSRSGLRIALKSRRGEAQKICSSNDADNFQVELHSPVQFPVGSMKYFHISPDTETLVAVTPDITLTDDALYPPAYGPKERGCTFPNEYEGYVYQNLTKLNCVIDELIETYIRNCNCTLLHTPIKGPDNETLPFCSPSDGRNRNCTKGGSTRLRSCLSSCHEPKYRYHLSNSKYQRFSMSENSIEDIQFTNLLVYFEDISFFAKRRSELYGLTDLIANCGGLLGLFTGFSFISAFEILYFASLRLACHMRERSKNNSKIYDGEEDGNLQRSVTQIATSM